MTVDIKTQNDTVTKGQGESGAGGGQCWTEGRAASLHYPALQGGLGITELMEFVISVLNS